jgi:DNA (cytosine-5)-methyltransferase 1
MDEETSKTLDAATGLNPTCSQGGTAVMQPIAIQDVTPREKAQNGKGWNDDGTSYTVDTAATQGVAQPIGCFKGGQGSAAGGIGYDEHIAPTLSAADSGSNRTPALMHGMAVRRLTPVECERLQGFPDEYTAIAWRKKPASECPDGPRYKALGNSWAVPVVRWIGKRIQEAIE